MSREFSRVRQGYFPTQDRIVTAISSLISLPDGQVTVLDAGCGCGLAIDKLRRDWLTRSPQTRVKLYGIESDKSRFEKAHELFTSQPGGGGAIWSAIEDCDPTESPSLLYFNPPYDRIRGQGRLELLLYNRVRHWTARNGYMVLIVPDYVLYDYATDMAFAIERDYRVIEVFRYPEPEYNSFKQCVLFAQRRERSIPKNTRIAFPDWARNAETWPILPDNGNPIVTLGPGKDIEFRRQNLGKDLILDVVSHSPLRNSLLREAMAPAPKIERPLMPLRDGHLALALAGGLCDGIIEAPDGSSFLIKGTLESKVCTVSKVAKFNEHGEHTQNVHKNRTRYQMKVRCLRENGSIEDYSSNEGEEVAMDDEDDE